MLTYLKKVIIFILTIAVIASSHSTVYALDEDRASDSPEFLSKNELQKIAVKAFPEHADVILEITPASDAFVSNNSADPFEKVTVYETRTLSDTEAVTYIEYESSLALYTYYKTVSNVSSSSGTGYSSKTVNVYVSNTGATNCYMLSNFKYTLVQSSYDMIDDDGTFYDSETVTTVTSNGFQRKETASSYAFVSYPAVFRSEIMTLSANCIFKVGGDSFSVYVNNKEI